MIFDDNSSNSGDSDDFGGLLKKVDYDVHIEDSDEN